MTTRKTVSLNKASDNAISLSINYKVIGVEDGAGGCSISVERIADTFRVIIGSVDLPGGFALLPINDVRVNQLECLLELLSEVRQLPDNDFQSFISAASDLASQTRP